MTIFMPPHEAAALPALGHSACSRFRHRGLITRIARDRHFSAGLFSFFLPASLLLSLTAATFTPSNAQTASSAQIERLVAIHSAKFAPEWGAQLADAARHNDPKTGVPALLPVIIQTDGTTPALARPLLGHTTFAAFKAARTQTPAFAPLNGHGTLAARLSPADIARLAADPHTTHISPDLVMQTCQTSTGPLYYDYAIQAVGADYVLQKNNLSGKGINVAVIDTGVYPHDDLTTPTQRITGWVDLVNGKTAPYDDNGHGTHVAGLVAGNGADSRKFGYNAWMVRTASSANIIGVKVLDQNGAGSVSTVIAGIDWCVAHKQSLNIRIINLSAGHTIGESYVTDPLCQACERACAAGIVVVCAAGNNGRSIPSNPNSATQWGSITSPGNDPHVITVGATNTMGTQARTDDVICTFSSRGPTAIDLGMKPDLVAPGNGIISLAAPGSVLYTQAVSSLLNPADYNGTGLRMYLNMSGTSMAAPIVAGAAAILLQADPTLSPDTIKARLMLSAGKVASMDYLSYGAGYVNVVGALQLTQVQVAATMALSPSVARNSDGTVSVCNFGWGGSIKGQNFGWGGDSIKCPNFGWGGDIVKYSNSGWGGDLPPTKNLTDYMTQQNFNWSDTFFLGSGVFGGKALLPQNFGTGFNPLWAGRVTALTTPNQTDAMHLMFEGD